MGERPEEVILPRDSDTVSTDNTSYGSVGNPATSGDPVEANREQVEQARAEMSETIDEIQERLSPQHLKEQAQGTVQDMTRQAKDGVKEATIGKVQGGGSIVMETVKQNPIPAALAAVGLGWLVMEVRKQRSQQSQYQYSYTPSYQEQDSGGTLSQSRAGQTASQVQDKAQQTVGQAQEQANQLSDQAQQQARQAKSNLQSMMQQNPLAAGVVAVGLGAAVGLMVPETSKENQVMGQARDSLVDKAQEKVQDARERVQQVAQQAQSSAKEEVQNQGLA